MNTCTECGAPVGNAAVCPRCRYPRWYTLKKVALCLAVVAVLIAIIKYSVSIGDRTLGQWFGSQ